MVSALAAGRLRVDHEALGDLCRRYHIARLALFGSVLRDDFTSVSDVDVLVEFEPENVPGFGFVALQEELSGILGRRVDLHTPSSLSRYFRDAVLAEAQDVYAA